MAQKKTIKSLQETRQDIFEKYQKQAENALETHFKF